MIDRGARTITTELEETERRARPHDDRLGAGCRGGRERSAAVPLGVVGEPETGLDARLHGVQPRADPGQAERVLPHLGRRGDERLAPPTASPVELGADRERDRKEEEPAGVASALHQHVEELCGSLPVLEREVGQHHQAEHVLGVGQVGVDECHRELGQLVQRVRHRRVGREESGLDAGHRTFDDVHTAGSLAALGRARGKRARGLDVEREHRDVHRVREQPRRARGIVGFDRVGGLDEDLQALLRPGPVRLELADGRGCVGAETRIECDVAARARTPRVPAASDRRPTTRRRPRSAGALGRRHRR